MDYFGRIKKHVLVGRGGSLGVGFEDSNAHTKPSLTLLSLLPAYGSVSTQLLLQPHAYLLAAMLPATSVIDSSLKKTYKQAPSILYKLP